MGILYTLAGVLGVITMLVGYFKDVFSLEISSFIWIGFGNLALFAAYLLFLADERRKWGREFLYKKPEYRSYEYLYQLHKLLAKARSDFNSGNVPNDTQLEQWHTKVVNTLKAWNSNYLDVYLMNDKPMMGDRIRQLDETLNFIVR